MKKILLVVFLLVLTATIANAANMNGDFKGNPIVKVKADGKELTVESTPAVIYNGNTLVPIYMLRQLGATVSWDANTYSVDVALPKAQSQNASDPIKATKDIISLGGSGLTFIESGGKVTAVTYFHKKYGYDVDKNNIDRILDVQLSSGADHLEIVYLEGSYESTMRISSKTLQDFTSGKITQDELEKSWILTGPLFSNTNESSGSFGTGVTTKFIDPLYLFSNDGKTFLGELSSNTYSTDSIFNEYGTYGNKYSSDSIWNEYGTYGGKYSSESALNPYASTPPIIVQNGKIVGYLTSNSTISEAVSPIGLLQWLKDNGY
jgi:hypothetical protein